MDIARATREKSSLLIVALALGLLGLGLFLSTWSTLARQRQVLDQHLLLAARSVLQTVGGALRRNYAMRAMRGPSGLTPEASELFREIQTGGDVLFIGVVARNGKRLVLAETETEAPELDAHAQDILQEQGEWSGMMEYGGEKTFVLARKVRSGPPGGARMHHGPGMGMGMWRQEPPDPESVPAYLVVGLDMTLYTSLAHGLQHNVMLTSAFILSAALVIILLALAFFRRRDMARRAVSLERLQSRLFDALPEGLLLIDGRGFVQAANPAASEILGPSSEDIVGRQALELPLSLPSNGGHDHDWRRRGHRDLQLEILTLDLPADEEGGEPGRLVLIRDRTQMAAMEERLAEARKLAALGSMAAGVAHEIRNPLSALRGFAQFFAKKFAGKNPEETYARTMVSEADRLNRVVTDMLHLSRPRAVEPRELELAPVLEEILRLLAPEAEKAGADMALDLKTETVLADEDGLRQALLNLGLNALEALRENGREAPRDSGSESPGEGGRGASEESGHEDRPRGRLVFSAEREGDSVRLAVIDNGPGMSEEDRSQAFEPFYTTKAKGTGLGLALVHKIVSDHGGRASILPAEGGGTRVELVFPENGENGRPPADKDSA